MARKKADPKAPAEQTRQEKKSIRLTQLTEIVNNNADVLSAVIGECERVSNATQDRIDEVVDATDARIDEVLSALNSTAFKLGDRISAINERLGRVVEQIEYIDELLAIYTTPKASLWQRVKDWYLARVG